MHLGLAGAILFGCGVHREGVLYPDWSACCSKDISHLKQNRTNGQNKSLIFTSYTETMTASLRSRHSTALL